MGVRSQGDVRAVFKSRVVFNAMLLILIACAISMVLAYRIKGASTREPDSDQTTAWILIACGLVGIIGGHQRDETPTQRGLRAANQVFRRNGSYEKERKWNEPKIYLRNNAGYGRRLAPKGRHG
jgi:hypothetical protein